MWKAPAGLRWGGVEGKMLKDKCRRGYWCRCWTRIRLEREVLRKRSAFVVYVTVIDCMMLMI